MKPVKWDELLRKIDPKHLFWLGLAGMLLLLLPELVPEKSHDVPRAETAAASSPVSYELQLEQRLEQLLADMDGVGQVAVMVTIASAEQAVFAVDTSDSAGGGAATDHVLLSDGSALQQTTLMPAINGVAVVCQGGGEIGVVAQITETLAALLDLPSNRISVQKMK